MTKEPTAGVPGLFEAVQSGADDTVVRLLRAGVPAEATDEEGGTALYRAAVNDEVGIVRLLLTAGADPDRASGPDGEDLPLCGAASGGNTDVVRALLEAGADPNLREAFGFTAVVWAVVQGFAGTVEALLEYGADPDLPGPGEEPLLLLAARRGSSPTVRPLLGHGAGRPEAVRRAALAEAMRWMSLDVEEELRTGLSRAYGDGYETVVRRVDDHGSVTVIVELLRDGLPLAGQEQGTGHAAVATLLEADLGVRTAYQELAGRALRCGAPERDDWTESVRVLALRDDEETFAEAAGDCGRDDQLRQAFAADVLVRLSEADNTGRFAGRSVPLLRALSHRATEPEPVRGAVTGLGLLGDPSVLPDVLRHAGHPDPGVRRAVASALGRAAKAAPSARPAGPATSGAGERTAEDRPGTGRTPAPPATPITRGACRPGVAGRAGTAQHAPGALGTGKRCDGGAALIALSRDADPTVRDRAVVALADLEQDTAGIREALAARLNDLEAETAASAARGLAIRQDPRAVAALARILSDEEPDGPARRTAVDALRFMAEGPERRRLELTLPRSR